MQSTKLVKIICVLGLGGDEKRRLSRLFFIISHLLFFRIPQIMPLC